MVYFDNAASSFPKPKSVTQAVAKWLEENGANPGRSGHPLAMQAAQVVFDARAAAAELFGFERPENVVFVQNATYGLNMLILGLFEPGEHIITTDLEHNSVLRPLYHLAGNGVQVTVIETDLYDDDNTAVRIQQAIKKNTAAIICTQASNVCGKIMPLSKISKICPPEVKLIVDGAQGAGSIDLNIKQTNIDYYCAPSHKGLMGPQGAGIVIINNEKLPRPLVYGGTGSASLEFNQPEFLPDRLESGTLPTPIIYGMLEGINYIKKVGIKHIFEHKLELTNYALDRLSDNKKIQLYYHQQADTFHGVVCFNVKGYKSEECAQLLAKAGICCRAGLHCAPLFHKKMGTEQQGMVRISFGMFNLKSQVDILMKKISEI